MLSRKPTGAPSSPEAPSGATGRRSRPGRNGCQHPLDPTAADQEEDHRRHRDRQVEGPEVAEALLERRPEEAAPDVRVGEVVDDRVGGAPRAPRAWSTGRCRRTGTGCRRPPGCARTRARRRRRGAAIQTAAAPVLSLPRRSRSLPRSAPAPGGNGQLRPQGKAGGEAGDRQRPDREGPRQPPGVEQDRDRGDEGASRRRRCWRSPAGGRTVGSPTSGRRRRRRSRRRAVWAADTPRGEQGEAEPAEVEQR